MAVPAGRLAVVICHNKDAWCSIFEIGLPVIIGLLIYAMTTINGAVIHTLKCILWTILTKLTYIYVFLHILYNVPPMIRVADKLIPIEGTSKLSIEEVEVLIFSLIRTCLPSNFKNRKFTTTLLLWITICEDKF